MPERVRGPVALDAVGGDHAPEETVRGALTAAQDLGIHVMLVGPSRLIRRELGRFRRLPERITIVDAPDVVTMDDAAVAVLRRKRRSSLTVCAELVRDGQAVAMVTAGNTGAAWVAAKARIGMIEGIDRPALAALLPSSKGHTLVLDVGATVEYRPERPFTDEYDPERYTGLVPPESVPVHEENWISCIRSGKKPHADIELAARTQAVISLGEMSDRLGIACHFDPKTRTITDGCGRKLEPISYGKIDPS